jgi:hypothetical protein
MITITDLPLSRALDVKAMSSLRGAAGAPWVYTFRPFVEPVASFGPTVNYFQQNNYNFTFVDKLVNQTTVLNIENSGDNANLTAVLIGSQGA